MFWWGAKVIPSFNIICVKRENYTYDFVHNTKTNEVYNYDSRGLIRWKCAGLTVVTPLVTVIRMVCRIATVIFTTLSIGFHYIDEGKVDKNELIALRINCEDIPLMVVYGVQLTGYAAYGIFFPFETREYYGRLERKLNRQQDGPKRTKFYAAFCFQPIWKTYDSNTSDAGLIEKLNDYIDRIERIKNAFWSFDYKQLMIELKIIKFVAIKQ
jgi:hypothetical protein